MEEKVKITLELDKQSIKTALFLMDENLSDELWQKLTSAPLVLDMDKLSEKPAAAKLVFAALAINQVKE